MIHQYIERGSGAVRTERLASDRLIRSLYSTVREQAPAAFRALTSARATDLMGYLQYDLPFLSRRRSLHMARRLGIDIAECVDARAALASPRALFERQIRYWDCRPLEGDPRAVVSPADARVLTGSLAESFVLPVKEKLFDADGLLGAGGGRWRDAFLAGDAAVFRLTPDKYHYNHTPVAGRVLDVYEEPGAYHSCNPGAVIRVVSACSLNARTITVFDTDVPGGTGAGRVAMVEVVAMMIGDVLQRYSASRYDAPRPLAPDDAVEKGCPKSLFRPGSSTVVLLFEPRRVRFSADLVANQARADVQSRFSAGFGRPVVETEVAVRSAVGSALPLCPPWRRCR